MKFSINIMGHNLRLQPTADADAERIEYDRVRKLADHLATAAADGTVHVISPIQEPIIGKTFLGGVLRWGKA